jgi:hypothetical protein
VGPDATAGREGLRSTGEVWVRLLGLIFLLAFWSLAEQAPGLWGSQGIIPVGRIPEVVASRELGFLDFPSIFRWTADDRALALAPGAGMLLGLLALLGITPAPALLLATWLYLSFSLAGGVFMGYQWDALLVEAGFLGALAAPWGFHPWPGRWPEPPRAAVWAYRLLLAKLMLQSAAVKLLSGDEAWRGWTALAYHYETQPLPTPLAWYAHQLPLWFQQLSTLATLVIEFAIPVLVFAGRRPRQLAAAMNLGLMALIALTGNYTFFNLLTAALSLWLLDDAALVARLPAAPPPPLEEAPPARPRRWVACAVGLAYGAACLALVHRTFAGREGSPGWVRAALGPLATWHVCNSYGLFAVMTTRRPELHMEGTLDGTTWLRYRFHAKPGPLDRPPPVVAPHQPRLDWQMWFAALGSLRRNPWMVAFMRRLLEASPPVLALLEHDPFEGRRPLAVRVTADRYRFTAPGADAWWRAEPMGVYAPPLTARNFQNP